MPAGSVGEADPAAAQAMRQPLGSLVGGTRRLGVKGQLDDPEPVVLEAFEVVAPELEAAP